MAVHAGVEIGRRILPEQSEIQNVPSLVYAQRATGIGAGGQLRPRRAAGGWTVREAPKVDLISEIETRDDTPELRQRIELQPAAAGEEGPAGGPTWCHVQRAAADGRIHCGATVEDKLVAAGNHGGAARDAAVADNLHAADPRVEGHAVPHHQSAAARHDESGGGLVIGDHPYARAADIGFR